jgi:hypothetical protein
MNTSHQTRRSVKSCAGPAGPSRRPALFLDEEIEGIDGHHVRDQIDRHMEMIHLLREHQPRLPVAEGILLPVGEALLGADFEAVAQHRRARMGRRAQPHHLRMQLDAAVVVVSGAMGQGDLECHGRGLWRWRKQA